jgi:hypothetical protein
MGENEQVSRIEAPSFENSDSAPRSENGYAPQMFDRRVTANTRSRRNDRHDDQRICAALPSALLGCEKLVHIQSESLNHAARSGFQPSSVLSETCLSGERRRHRGCTPFQLSMAKYPL